MSEDDKTYQPPRGQASRKPSSGIQILPGAVLKGTYRVDEELGSGGMGTVFLATHLGLEKRMAVKVLSTRAISSPENLARFEREAKVAGKVSHPAMTQVIDFGVEQGTPYLVMEYVDGVELAELIERQGPMPPRQAVAVMRQIVSLLHAAHALGIVHRDLKPSNIKVIQAGPDGQLFVKVLDFGIAKVVGDIGGQLTSTGMMVGTPAYMAPEQISGKPIDGRTDLYAAGLIFHELLSGVRAYQGETIARILHAQLNEPPPPISLPLPDGLRQTLQKFYEKRPEDRFQDAAEADRALMACEEALRSAPVSTVAPVPPQAGAARAPAMAPGAFSATMKRPEAGAAQAAAAAPGAFSATMKRPEAGAAEHGPAAVAPAPARPVTDRQQSPSPMAMQGQPRPTTDRQPAPVPPVVVPAQNRPPAPAVVPGRKPPARSSFLGRGCLLAVLVVGGLGCLGLGGIFVLAAAQSSQENHEADVSAPAPVGSSSQRGSKPVRTPKAKKPPADSPVPLGDELAGEDRPLPNEGTGCYVTHALFRSSLEEGGQHGPWEFETIISHEPVDCAAVPKGRLSPKEKALMEEWGSAQEVLQVMPLSSPEPVPDDPGTRQQEFRIYTRESSGMH
ncbi:MAG: serine/threonine protein kinase [Myxococcaceae bacterium]|nr:serine/threonine protein kinase [Myxococcaceae bacterium]